MSENKENNGTAVFIIIIILAVLITIFGIVCMTFGKSSSPKSSKILQNSDYSSKNIFSPFMKKEKVSKPEHHGKYIAKLYIEGTIEEANSTYNQEWVLETIDDLNHDKDNAGIILFLNTPGGGVYESDEVYLALLDYKKTGKPVYAYMGQMAASGGYYISCAADSIIANRNTLTGSIGVIAGASIDITKMLDNFGVKYTTIHAGKNKNMGNVNEPLSDEQRKILQSVADECYEQFTTIVATARKMKIEDVIKLADGRVYTAKQAQLNGLIDSIGTFDNAVLNMEDNKLDSENYDVVDYRYEQKRDIYSYLLGSAASFRKAAGITNATIPDVVENAISEKTPYPAYIYEGAR